MGYSCQIHKDHTLWLSYSFAGDIKEKFSLLSKASTIMRKLMALTVFLHKKDLTYTIICISNYYKCNVYV